MAVNYEYIAAKAAELSIEDRAKLAKHLLLSLDEGKADDPAEVERLWAEEISRRVDELERGEAELLDGEEVMAKLRARLPK